MAMSDCAVAMSDFEKTRQETRKEMLDCMMAKLKDWDKSQREVVQHDELV